MSKEKIDSIIKTVSLLKDSPTIIGLLGDKAGALISNEVANVAAILKNPVQGQSLQAAQAKLIDCTPQSWALLVTQAVQLGVTLNPFQKHCAIIPYGNLATMTIMVAGLKHLLYTNNIILSMTANAVCEKDIFEMSQPLIPQTIKDNFKFSKSKTERGKCIGAYAFFVLANGQFIGDYLPVEEVEKRKAAAKTDYIWNAWKEEMYEKSAIRYVQKQMPTFAKFEALLNEIENQHFDFTKQHLPESSKKQSLTAYHPKWGEAVKGLFQGDTTVLELQKRFDLSEDNKQLLIDHVHQYEQKTPANAY